MTNNFEDIPNVTPAEKPSSASSIQLHPSAFPSTQRTNGRSQGVTERVVDELKGYIETNALKPGDKLPPERVFIEQLNVSRSSLREALRILSTIGMVDVRHGDGMYVASGSEYISANASAIFDATEQYALRNLIETRMGIELAAVSAATERASDEDLLGLEQFLDDQERELAENPNFVWEPLGFEMAIVELTANSWLYEVESMLRDAWVGLSSGLRTSVGRHHEWQSEHRAIVASMRSRNVTQARRLVIAHLSLERFEEDLEKRSDHHKKSAARGAKRKSKGKEKNV
jgi:GntR family transcriptional regulator, transcriptional repressor for pyruvate dehydrogenase complex